MPEITYETIKPLLAKEEERGGEMACTFTCPVSGVSVDASGAMHKAESAVGRVADQMKQSVKRSLFYSIRNAVTNAVGDLLGGGTAGRIGRQAAYSATGEAERRGSAGSGAGPSFSEAEKQAAVVEAFNKVAAQFVWDAENDRWIAAKLRAEMATEFSRQMDAAPITQIYDHGVLARMLTEIASADGKIGDDERAFLEGFAPAGTETVDELAKKPPLSNVELDEATKGEARETMLMLAWALALTDESLAEEELARLDAYAEGLGIGTDRAAELKRCAQVHIVDQAIAGGYAAGHDQAQVKAHALELAGQIGLDPEEAERAEVKYRKRVGKA